MDNTIFAQSVARIRFLETKLLDLSKLQALVEARDFEDCIRMLQDTVYNEYINSASYEKGLKEALQDLYADMYKTSPVREVVDIFAAKYDAHNIKSLIKSRITRKDVSDLLINAGSIQLDNLKIMFSEDSFRDMPEALRPFVEKALESKGDNHNPQDIDISIDRGLYRYMLKLANKSELSYLAEIVVLMIDIANIKAFVRIKFQDKGREFFQKTYIPGGKLDLDVFTGNISDPVESFPGKLYHTDHYKWIKPAVDEFVKLNDLGIIERYGDNFLIRSLWKSRLVSFGPEPLVAYIIARENEIKALRIILTGKKNNMLPDNIRERLRDVYV